MRRLVIFRKQSHLFLYSISSVIGQKGESPNFLKNEDFLPPDTHTYVCVSGGKKCSFFREFGVLCFLETPVLRFALLSYYRRFILCKCNCKFLRKSNINVSNKMFFLSCPSPLSTTRAYSRN